MSESAYSAAAAVYGMLVRSVPWGGRPQSGSAASATPLVQLWPAGGAFANATFFRLRCEGALLASAVRENGSTRWAAVEADLLADGSGSGAPVSFVLFAEDWVGVAALTVVAAPGVAATLIEPGAFAVTGLVRGAAAAFFPSGASPPPAAFDVDVALGRNASEANTWGSTFVYGGILS